MQTVTAKSGKKYTAKQIQEAIAYWQKQLDESLFGGNPVKKFFKELQNALDTGRPVFIGASKKNGNTLAVSSFRRGGERVTFYTDRKELLKASDFIDQMMKAGVTAKDVKEIQVVFDDGSYPIVGATTMDARTLNADGIIVIADVGSVPNSVVGKFFS